MNWWLRLVTQETFWWVYGTIWIASLLFLAWCVYCERPESDPNNDKERKTENPPINDRLLPF